MVTQQEPQCYGWKLLVGAWQRDNHLLGEAAIERSVLLIHVEAWRLENLVLHEVAKGRTLLSSADYALSILKLNLVLNYSLFVGNTSEECARDSYCKSIPEMHYPIIPSHFLLYNPPPFSLQSHW